MICTTCNQECKISVIEDYYELKRLSHLNITMAPLYYFITSKNIIPFCSSECCTQFYNKKA